MISIEEGCGLEIEWINEEGMLYYNFGIIYRHTRSLLL